MCQEPEEKQAGRREEQVHQPKTGQAQHAAEKGAEREPVGLRVGSTGKKGVRSRWELGKGQNR